MKFSLFFYYVLVTYTAIVTAGTVEEVTTQACEEVKRNAKEIQNLFLEISKLKRSLYAIKEQIHEETEHTINEVIENDKKTLEFINKIDQENCRAKAEKELKTAYNLTITDINIGCQKETIEKIDVLQIDLKETNESLSKVNKTNSEIIQFCFNTTNQEAEQLEQCFKAQDNEVKDEIQKCVGIVNIIKNQVTDIEINVEIVIKCIQASSWIFNQMTDRIIVDVKKCAGID
ncbi:uncharacterized protein LOC123301064 [Chrysoperla carnea]|uniref:uncharacterized protein LOC123301064 n=1 Tax=Chrysoperla carnea TaxID=189513 RepID=UPI001D075216|nr:uncharacterized protein LOC123301064 [Chrysoperla carnea]